MPDGPSRRRLLRAVGATSGLGLLGAAGTWAFVSDEESSENLVESRGIDLEVGFRVTDGPLVSMSGEESAATDDSPFRPIERWQGDPEITLEPAQRKTIQFSLSLSRTDLMALFMRVRTAGRDYEHAVEVRWDVAEDCAFSDPSTTTLHDLSTGDFGDGGVIWESCPAETTTPDMDMPVCVGFELFPRSSLEDDLPLSVPLTCDFLAEQCEPVTDPSTESPWQ